MSWLRHRTHPWCSCWTLVWTVPLRFLVGLCHSHLPWAVKWRANNKFTPKLEYNNFHLQLSFHFNQKWNKIKIVRTTNPLSSRLLAGCTTLGHKAGDAEAWHSYPGGCHMDEIWHWRLGDRLVAGLAVVSDASALFLKVSVHFCLDVGVGCVPKCAGTVTNDFI